uniref:Uncharacterized protein n=1 Tax=Trypanosoma congolense (strain IL3000) TaxID=1068625 RepID=G0UM84_TRYCI|nr:hypothetical protein TCIL3000_5_5100 [Trypanosoma congolense IL3000]
MLHIEADNTMTHPVAHEPRIHLVALAAAGGAQEELLHLGRKTPLSERLAFTVHVGLAINLTDSPSCRVHHINAFVCIQCDHASVLHHTNTNSRNICSSTGKQSRLSRGTNDVIIRDFFLIPEATRVHSFQWYLLTKHQQ